jgi:hypothetical protein
MAETLNDNDLKSIVKVITDLEKYQTLNKYEQGLRDKAIRIITRQPDPIPYCNCNAGDWCHDFSRPYCRKCYGVPASYKP